MPWRRRGNQFYFYRTERAGSRAHAVYIGKGPAAEALAAEIEERKAMRLARRVVLAAAERERAEAIVPLLRLDESCGELMHTALAEAGYYQHCRGEWRKSKVNAHTEPDKNYPVELRDALLLASAGDESALPAVKAGLDTYPELVPVLGDLAVRARESLLSLIAGNDLATREAVRRHAASLRDELIGDHPSPVVRVLADRASVCWIDVHGAELALTAQLRSQPDDLQLVRSLCCRVDSAQRRFVASLKAVATVTKLLPKRSSGPLELLRLDVQESPPIHRSRTNAGIPAGQPNRLPLAKGTAQDVCKPRTYAG